MIFVLQQETETDCWSRRTDDSDGQTCPGFCFSITVPLKETPAVTEPFEAEGQEGFRLLKGSRLLMDVLGNSGQLELKLVFQTLWLFGNSVFRTWGSAWVLASQTPACPTIRNRKKRKTRWKWESEFHLQGPKENNWKTEKASFFSWKWI